jgi:hypothetical protein
MIFIFPRGKQFHTPSTDKAKRFPYYYVTLNEKYHWIKNTTMHGLKFTLLILTFLVFQSADAQPSISLFQTQAQTDSVTIAANPDFQASGLHRFLFGSLWRDVWATPVKAEKLILNTPIRTLKVTRLIPIKEKVFFLDLIDSLGAEYSFEPIISKSTYPFPSDFSVLLPPSLVLDQLSTLNPYTWLILPPIFQALELPYRDIKLVFLPSNELPGMYRRYFGNKLGLLRYPLHFPSSDTAASHRINLISTDAVIKLNEFSPRNERIDELQYLKSRIVDILLGNWNRSPDKWMWQAVRRDKYRYWEPVSMWGAFSQFQKLDGLFPTIADLVVPELEACDENISNVENLTLAGRELDRRLLISYPKQTWDSLAAWIQTRISDSLLTTVVSRLPIPILEKEGKVILHILQSRRAQLLKAVEEFYKLSSEYVEIHGSNRAESVEIRRIGRHMVFVAMYDRFDNSHTPFYQRLFHDDLTKEIRLLLLGGDDKTIIEGEESGTIKIIVDGGSGKNELVDMSRSRSIFSDLNLFSSSVVFYNNDSTSRIKSGSNTQVIRDWGSEWSFSPWLDINPDDGLFIGGGPVYTQYGYRMEPYTEQIGVRAGLTTETRRYRFDATGEFRDWFGGVSTFLQLHASQLDLSNFFGLGNKTTYSSSLEKAGFYKVDQRQIFFHAAFDFAITTNTRAEIGSTIKLIDNNPKPGTLLDTLQLSYYNKSLTFLNLSARIQADTRDAEKLPTRGFYLKAEASYLPKMFDNTDTFTKLRCEARTYITPVNIQMVTIAIRAAGEKIWGNHPFFESAFLGGNESLRGFERQRFAGDASLLGGVEVRARVTQIPFLVPLWAGISGFAETGRVFIDGEQSNLWHNAIGGGIWFSIIKPEYLVSFNLASSKDEVAFYTTLGFTF